MKIKLTKSALDALNLCQNNRIEYRIEDYKYLRLRVSSRKVFIYYRKIKGITSPKKITIGEYPILSIEKVKARYNELNSSYADGKLLKNSTNITFEELFQSYCSEKSNVKKSLHYDIFTYQKYLSRFANYPISQITYDIIKSFHKEHEKNIEVTSNRCLALLSSLYSYANKELRISVENPAKGIKKYVEYPRRRILNSEEMKRFLSAIEAWSNIDTKSDIADLIKCFLYTGQRKTNCMRMKFSELDLEAGEWHISGKETKNKEDMAVSLHDDIISILKRRKKKIKGEYVFPSPVKPNEPVQEIKRQWKQFLKSAGITNLTVHDLRRSFGAYLLMSSKNLKLVQEALGHKDIGTTARVYTPIIQDYKKKAINEAFKRID